MDRYEASGFLIDEVWDVRIIVGLGWTEQMPEQQVKGRRYAWNKKRVVFGLFVLASLKLTFDYMSIPGNLQDAMAHASTIETDFIVTEGTKPIGKDRIRQIHFNDLGGSTVRLSCGEGICQALPYKGHAKILYYEGAILVPWAWLLEIDTPNSTGIRISSGQFRNIKMTVGFAAIIGYFSAFFAWLSMPSLSNKRRQ